ncbi:hypothetical protein VOLCADRAFT_115926 [Volvox carteri f. nagariensis]|uniref:Uncharacterized protein n=1 Tax=Volvox carteri f. nagariensis TaxID=3068 RepID=D8TIZ2_VOLCA|nr:uncharacterized protein VOLCADRAFT_115926 [Volvox carteri f. nagariensis]EFJ52283.1 hypothetical protein VOLCADRAFT_115926 [Volvox carteri f. nagariensis]|eukprot:XP_002946356.1 hypothetical protein VOLCADRAFT_115926 [Volvox carteri f. nagariensis]
MPARKLLEIEPPGAVRYILGLIVMLVGVILPLAYAFLRRKNPLAANFRPLRTSA